MSEGFLHGLAEVLEVQKGALVPSFVLQPIDSLTLISIIALADEHYQAELNGEDIEACVDIGSLLALIDRVRGLA